MFKNDRMMMILTGLVLAVFAGSMVRYGDRIIGILSGETEIASQDDSYSVRAGAVQILDVLSNDSIKGPIVVLTQPGFGTIELTGSNKLSFTSPADSNGAVEFAYCVDADGACNPNAVKINVISVNLDLPVDEPASTPEASIVVAATPIGEAPDFVLDAIDPNVADIAVEMVPPALNTPDMTEQVSPDAAVAAIRQSSGGLNRASETDQNIAAQNSAAAAQAAAVDPSAFQAPTMGETNNISLGGADRVVAATIAAPSGLQAAPSNDANITQLERGPEALAAIQSRPGVLAPQESSPLLASPEQASFAPADIAVAKSTASNPDQSFSAVPNTVGPMALVALQGTNATGNASGESLNVILSEPGVQTFAKALVPPSALAPTSAAPSEVAVLEREPSAAIGVEAPALPGMETSAGVFASRSLDADISRSPLAYPDIPLANAALPFIPARVIAALPNQITAPDRIVQYDLMNLFISPSRRIDETSRAANIARLSSPLIGTNQLPAIGLVPADKPIILQASLPNTPIAPVITAPQQNSACAISLAADVQNGANIMLDISAPCKPAQMVTITHAGLAFSVLTDAQGMVRVNLPAMEAEAEITANFEDQSSASTTISVPDVDSVLRAGVSWRADMNLDLNAFEYGAAAGTEGHVSPQSPRDYRTSRIKGGGYLLQLGDPQLERGALAEVYTFPINRNQERGTVALSIVIIDADRLCGQAIVAKTSRSREGRGAGQRNVRFNVPDCGSVAGQVTLPGALDDIRLAGR